jgi:hypothetical protein
MNSTSPEFDPNLSFGPKDIRWARHLLGHSRNSTLGTTDSNGESHLSSITFAFRSSPEPEEPALEAIMWGDSSSRHVRYVANTAGRVSIHLARSDSNRNSITLRGIARELDYDDETPIMLNWLNKHRTSWGMPKRSLDEFLPEAPAPRRLYQVSIDGATMPASKLGERKEWVMNAYKDVDLNSLRGFEQDPWRLLWLKHIGGLSMRLFRHS